MTLHRVKINRGNLPRASCPGLISRLKQLARKNWIIKERIYGCGKNEPDSVRLSELIPDDCLRILRRFCVSRVLARSGAII